MNALKLGHTALGLSLEDYIIPIQSDKPFTPLSHSIVLYPKSYEKLYGIESPIAKCFKSCFSIQAKQQAGVTLWDVAYKVGAQ